MMRRRMERREAPPVQQPVGPQPMGQAGGAQRYVMREKMFTIGDDFFIQNGVGQRVFKIDGKALRIRSTLLFEDAQGRELATIRERMAAVKDTMTIEKNGQPYAVVKKALITPVRERYTVSMPGGDLEIKGNILDHEYTFERNGRRVAEVSKKWVRVRDTYTVEVMPGEEDIIILASAVAIDSMTSS
jgi:uncharacterized protein YxjI